MLIKFPFRYKKINFGKIPDPTVELLVETNSGWQKFDFLVDSGADATSLPLELAQFIGAKIEKRKKTVMGGVGAQGINAYPSEIKVKLGEKKLSLRCYFVESDAVPLLGRTDVWDQFSLLFDSQKEEILFKKIKDSPWSKLISWLGF